MATKKKLLEAAAGSAGGEALNVEDVFSTYLYEGNGSTQTITNGIDLAGEGGLVWTKTREVGNNHNLQDTERGTSVYLQTNNTNAEQTRSDLVTSFNSNGFTLGADASLGTANFNGNGGYASWTFRKAPKFFDVVTYTGNGVAGRTVSHNLGSVPGCIIVKATNTAKSWPVYHRGADATAPEDKYLFLNFTSAAQDNSVYWNDTAPTSTEFTVGTDSSTNGNGNNYVAYLFAHNDGDGEFGPTGDQDIIKCGSFSTDSSGNSSVNLGFEPQFLLTKSVTETQNWDIVDVMRGMPVNYAQSRLGPNQSDAETTSSANIQGYAPTPTGFDVKRIYDPSETYIYIAIRRGPMAVPESATDVFAIDNGIGSTANPAFDSTFPVDFVIQKDQSGSASYVGSRLQGPYYLQADGTNAETDDTGWVYDHMDGYYSGNRETDDYSWMWKRAPNYFDVVAYESTGTVGQTFNHNLGAVPEMMWFKNRDSAYNWIVYHKDIGASNNLVLNSTAASVASSQFNSTTPTDTVFTLGGQDETNGFTQQSYIAYLFASLDGVSRVGSYDGTGGTNTQVIDCGFSAGARFVLLKRYNASGYDWQVFDTERGITSGNDAKLALNTTAAESTLNWGINPNSSGFEVTGNGLNETGGSWIFYAIA